MELKILRITVQLLIKTNVFLRKLFSKVLSFLRHGDTFLISQLQVIINTVNRFYRCPVFISPFALWYETYLLQIL